MAFCISKNLFFKGTKSRSGLIFNNPQNDRIPCDIEFVSIVKKAPQPSPGFDSIDEEKSYLWNKLQPLNYLSDKSCILRHEIEPVQFVADLEHSETIKIKNDYDILKNKISKIISTDDFLKIVLEQLSR